MSTRLCRASSFFPAGTSGSPRNVRLARLLTCLFSAMIAGMSLWPSLLRAGTAPSILTQPSSLVVTQGTGASFSVSATGDAPLSYQWRVGGGSLTNATNNTFTIATAQLTDAGNYDVVLTNVSGAVTSAVARLT